MADPRPLYPAAVRQGLYEASTSRKHNLGLVVTWETDQGLVDAMYVQNQHTATLPHGIAIGRGTQRGLVNYLGNISVMGDMILGGLAASMGASSTGASSTAGGFGWVILAGCQTNPMFATSAATSAAARALVLGSTNGAWSTGGATTQNSTANNFPSPAILRANTATFATGNTAAGAVGAYIDWLWR